MSERIKEAIPKIFDFPFPLYDENHREELCSKILLHYFNREIGLETYRLWKLYLEERLLLEMPYYNQLYETCARKYDYLVNLDTHKHGTGIENSTENVYGTSKQTGTDTTSNNRDTTETDTRTISDSGQDVLTRDINTTGNSSGTTTTTGENSNSSTGTIINSDYPQATFNKGTDYASGSQQTQNQVSGTESNTVKNTSESTGKENSTDTTAYGKVVNDNLSKVGKVVDGGKSDSVIEANSHTGKTGEIDTDDNVWDYGTAGSKTKLLVEYRESIINVDKMVVTMLSDLFMGVY